jgi:negative regulator of flagellin synthesis FlgM
MIMTDIHPVGGLPSSTTLRKFAEQSPGRTDAAQPTGSTLDRVEISDLASLLSRLAELPEARAKKIVAVRNAIADGRYETAEKLEVATERLLEDLSADF